jgi:thioredoxin reductase (NADPH)
MVALDLKAVAFPRLDERQLADLGRCSLATLKRYRDEERLFETGARDNKFFVVKSGEVALVDEFGDTPTTIAVLGPGEFTGEVAAMTGAPTFVCGVARGDCEVYEVSLDALRQILNGHPDIGDTVLQAFIARRQILRESSEFTGPRVIGSRYSQETFRVRDFLARNLVPFTWLDLEADPEVAKLLDLFEVAEADTPVVAWGRNRILRNPSDGELADALGLRRHLEQALYDLVVVGAGPAGLAAAVYGASEGLSTVVLDRSGPGGQAGRSMRIENYLGFPAGITGGELAERAFVQATKFGAILQVPTKAAGLTFAGPYPVLRLEDGATIKSKCLLIATGADYRRLTVEGCEALEGRGVYYAATMNEAKICRDAEVMVVGGGNSAGQPPVFLAGVASKVYHLLRGDHLHKNMSTYLAGRIESTPNIEVLRDTEVRRMSGAGHLSEVEIIDHRTGEARIIKTPALFSFIGAVPRVEWLPPEIERDAKGFVRTGPALARSPHWTERRDPSLLETSRPGVFAAGDIRSGSMKRVASAVGEGAMAVQLVHEYLRGM